MSTLQRALLAALLATPALSSMAKAQTPSASARQMITLVPTERMSTETQDSLIDRLRRVLSQISRSEPAHLSSSLRLADLLTERARIRFMQEIEANCKGCRGSEADRREAIALYESARSRTPRATQGAVLFQLAHLYQMGLSRSTSAEQSQSRRLFEEIIRPRSGYPSEIVLRAHEGLGDIAFQTNQPKKAIEHYRKALRGPDLGSHGVMNLRIAWSLFHINRLVEGTQTLERLLASPTLLARRAADGQLTPDLPLQIDVARDLAIFYARRPISERQIAAYQRLIPDAETKSLLLGFSEEADRIGQKRAAKEILQRYMLLTTLTQEERTQALIRLTQVRHDAGDSLGSLAEFESAARAVQKTRCESDKVCDEMRISLRRFVTELHKLHKVNPPVEVLKAYQVFAATYPKDTEMAILGAQVALEQRNHRAAASLYRMASESIESTSANQSEAKKLLETALMGEIEAAELSKDATLRESAYANYLNRWPNGPQAFEIRYQQAQLVYERKDWRLASSRFAELALGTESKMISKQNRLLQKKAADLALDALAVEKRDAEIEALARQFAERLPAEHRNEFLAVARRAATNQIAALANSPDVSSRQLNQAIEMALNANLSQASVKEREIHFNNLAVLGERAQRDDIVHRALEGQMSLPGISLNERNRLMARRIGLYETRLQFDQAYALAKRLATLGRTPAERELRLGTLADLAGANPRSYYRRYLRLAKSGSATRAIRARLVELSTDPSTELRTHLKELAREPRLLGELVLLSYARQPQAGSFRRLLAQPEVRRNPATKLVDKHRFFASAQTLRTKVAAHRLDASSDRSLGSSVQARNRLLLEVDQQLKQATTLRDFTSSVLAFDLLQRENHRFVQDLMGLPLPKGLSLAEREKYQTLLSQQAAPFQRKAAVAEAKLNEFWSNPQPLRDLAREVQAARREIRPLLTREVSVLLSYAPRGEARQSLEQLLELREPSASALHSARSEVAAAPQNVSAIERLIAIEKRIGHSMLVPVLERRLEQIRRQERPRLAQMGR
jgi:hypothetical protein